MKHTPYAGPHRPFTIGLAPLDLAAWIEPDDHLLADLAEKDRLLATARDVVLREEAETRGAQAEVLDLLAAHLPKTHPERFTCQDGGAGRRLVIDGVRGVELDDATLPPLAVAARLVQEDLVLMRRGPEGWRLAAACLCFPSSWSLAEKFGKAMPAIHAAVPGYAERMAVRIDRIFDSLKVELPVWRLNWSLYPDAERHHPESKQLPRNWFDRDDDPAYVRVERQTLRKLPCSGDILFTIRIHVDPVAAFAVHPDGARLAAALRDQLLGLDAKEAAYKAVTAHRERIAAALDRIVVKAAR